MLFHLESLQQSIVRTEVNEYDISCNGIHSQCEAISSDAVSTSIYELVYDIGDNLLMISSPTPSMQKSNMQSANVFKVPLFFFWVLAMSSGLQVSRVTSRRKFLVFLCWCRSNEHCLLVIGTNLQRSCWINPWTYFHLPLHVFCFYWGRISTSRWKSFGCAVSFLALNPRTSH